jgi:hypothetical protein
MPRKTNEAVINTQVSNKLTPERKTIGIWDPVVTGNGVLYNRNNKHPDARNWSMVNTIPVKNNRKRLILLGESVARGYLFDPYFNPAMCLEQLLTQSGAIDAEVIDLAKVSIGIEELTTLTHDCLEAEPDAIIVFAGNNWFNSLRKALPNDLVAELEASIEKYSSVSSNGKLHLNNTVLGNIQAAIEARMLEITNTYIDILANIAATRKIPVVFIVPEFNLLDWKSTDTEQILFRLPDEDLKNWLSYKTRAEALLAGNNYTEAAAWARKMIDTDMSHPLGYELLSQYYLHTNNMPMAAESLEAARDTSVFCRSTGQARIYKVIQKALTESAPDKGIDIVNLSQVFREYSNGKPSGRDFFIDYCHLNDKGIIVAMTHTARKIVDLFAAESSSDSVIDPGSVEVDKTVRSIAYLCAAVHNAHYGQPQEIIDYLCAKALGEASVVFDVAEWYTDFSTRKTASVLCKSYENAIESEILIQYNRGKGFTSKPGYKLMDIELVDSMTTHLKANGGDDKSDVITALRISQHGINVKGIDLLKPFYTTSSYDDYLGTSTPFYRSRNVVSGFYVIADEDSEGFFKITCRVPGTQLPDEAITITINGTEVAALAPSLTWKNHAFSVQKGVLKKGVNQLCISWPVHAGNVELNATISNPYIIDKLSAVFGDIHMFKASSC